MYFTEWDQITISPGSITSVSNYPNSSRNIGCIQEFPVNNNYQVFSWLSAKVLT